MKTKISVLFYAKKSKAKSNLQVPVYLRITVNGKRSEFSTGKNVDLSKWNPEISRLKGNSEEARTINKYFDVLLSKILEIERNLTLSGESFEATDVRNLLTGRQETERHLIPIFQDHNDRMEKLIGKDYALATLKNFKTCLAHLKQFLWSFYKKSDINIKKIEPAFLNDFDFFLRTVAKCNNNSTVKHTKNLAKILKICYQNTWIEKDLVVYYKGKFNEVATNYLTQEEIKSIQDKDFAGQGLNLVRDIFIFSCYTGLAYIDIYNLTKDRISTGIDGNLWIMTHRQKTHTASNIPLLPIADEILRKYENHPLTTDSERLLPMYTNQKVNEYLKTIAETCGITKKLTFHVARHTFATTVTLGNNVSMESVSKMLGHRSIKTTQHYAKILDKKVSEDMSSLKTLLTARL
ncbi:site-specific integrase [Elizabethkingia meningoseptica]|uniref:site-specific integrase n=1 Tax=Elizabethkingia TaxID=308865 RepID=UPI001905E659|nr:MULTISPECIES: site-specific integrase [Elizabethkingia]MCT3927018.1 site-specific integrase [Elizabethkingia anophelis]MCT4101596.1 site-specific integrase [Elizabethkingia anophelis]MCT4166142.1 site-specific integrase [Elizabethkingia anophelis]MDE5447923.1 site-specific integrase [Elizabethkingia meningoseptica]MDE5516275.1 site-specific integrase [Elizabethkingia meningoseptica]